MNKLTVSPNGKYLSLKITIPHSVGWIISMILFANLIKSLKITIPHSVGWITYAVELDEKRSKTSQNNYPT